MLHFARPVPNNNMIRRPQRSDSLAGLGFNVQENALLAQLPDELHDMRRVQAYGQEEDLKEALGKMIGRVEELSAMLSQAQKGQTELETNLKLARSNLQLALANNEMLEDALRRESAIGSKDVGWRRRSDRPDSRQGHHAKTPSESLANSNSRPPSRQGSASVQSTPTSEAMASPIPDSPSVKPAAASPVTTQPVQQDSRFFRFRFGSSSASASPNPTASAGPSRPRTPPVSAGAIPGSGSRRAVDAIRDRERDASHLTSASLPSLVASTSKREDELVAELAEVRAKLEKVSSEKHTLEQEVEALSQALFEEANKMVAQERIKCAEIEEELRMVRQEKEALKSAMKIVEQENELLKSPPAPNASAFATADAAIGEDDPTPQGSRDISQIHTRRASESESTSPASALGSTDASTNKHHVTHRRSTSSTRGLHQKSSSSERGWGESSTKSTKSINDSPSYASIPLPNSPSESGSIISENTGNVIEESKVESRVTPTLLLTSPTLPEFPFEESPWTRL